MGSPKAYLLNSIAEVWGDLDDAHAQMISIVVRLGVRKSLMIYAGAIAEADPVLFQELMNIAMNYENVGSTK